MILSIYIPRCYPSYRRLAQTTHTHTCPHFASMAVREEGLTLPYHTDQSQCGKGRTASTSIIYKCLTAFLLHGLWKR